MDKSMRYDDQQRAEFIELAQQIGIGRTIRELGYPTYPTAQAWMRAAGVTPNIDSAYAQMKQWHTFYQVEDLLVVIDEGISAAQELIATCDDADSLKKLSESLQKLANTRLLLEGKSTSITEKREKTSEDSEFEQALREFRAQSSPGGIEVASGLE
jgi:hypothetical protein